MSPEDTIREALREYVGDGDGADEEVLDEYTKTVLIEHNKKWVEGFIIGWSHAAAGGGRLERQSGQYSWGYEVAVQTYILKHADEILKMESTYPMSCFATEGDE